MQDIYIDNNFLDEQTTTDICTYAKTTSDWVVTNDHWSEKFIHYNLITNPSVLERIKDIQDRIVKLIEVNEKQKSFVEVKNVTLFRNKDTAEFPDAVTSRGTKHLLTLIDAIKKGYKSYLLFLVQIQNMEKFKIAKDIDKEYYNNYLIAKKAGVNFLAYRCDISSKKIFIDKKLKIIDD